MNLFFRDFGGEGRNIVILHGLFGSSKNWITAGKLLSRFGRVFALDHRNHGDSPHSDSHSLNDLVQDLNDWLHQNNVSRPILIGHSMGGLAAMAYSLEYGAENAGSVEDTTGSDFAPAAQIILDISPRSYPDRYANEFAALRIDVSSHTSRQEIDAAMKQLVPDSVIRQFLQMNLEKTQTGYRWKINTAALEKADTMRGFSDFAGKISNCPTLVIRAGKSDYFEEGDIDVVQQFFPGAEFENIMNADHWLHISSTEEFLRIVREFLRRFQDF